MRDFNRFLRRIAAALIAVVVFTNTDRIAEAGSIAIRVGSIEAAAGGNVEVPIDVIGGKGAEGVQFVLSYDPKVIENVAVDAGPVAGAGDVDLKVREPGKIRVALLLEKPLSEDGTLLIARFNVLGETGSKSPLEFSEVRVFEFDAQSPLEMLVTAESGTFTVADKAAPTIPMLWIGIAAGVVVLLLLFVLRRAGSRRSN